MNRIGYSDHVMLHTTLTKCSYSTRHFTLVMYFLVLNLSVNRRADELEVEYVLIIKGVSDSQIHGSKPSTVHTEQSMSIDEESVVVDSLFGRLHKHG